MSRTSSGSVPSMAMVTPLTRNGSSMVLSDSSSESRPSRRARSASPTTSGIIAAGGSTLPVKASFSELTMFFASIMVPPAMLISSVVPKTRISGAGSRRLIGLPPSITLDAMTTANPPPIPIAGAGSISALPVPVGVRQGSDRREWAVVVSVVGLGDGLVSDVGADGDHLTAVGADQVDDLLEGLRDDVLLAVDQGDHRVGGR